MPTSSKFLYADYVRTIATIAVILLHSAGDLLYDFSQASMFDGGWWVGNVLDSAVRWCVPVFVMLSGSLLMNPNKIESIGDFLRKRWLRVATPFVFWSIIYLLYDFRGYIRDHKWPWWPDVWYKFFFEDVYFHLWFVPMILGLYFLIPTFRVFLKAAKRVDIEYFLVFWFYVSILQVSFSNFIIVKYIGWLAYIGYIILGYYISHYDIHQIKLLYRTAWVSLVVTIIGTWYLALYFHGFHHHTAIFYMYMSPNVIFMGAALFYHWCRYDWAAFAKKYPKIHGIVGWFSGISFGVYLLHALILDVFKNGYVGNIVISANTFLNIKGHPIWCVPLFLTSTVLTSALIIWFLQKIPFLKKIVC